MGATEWSKRNAAALISSLGGLSIQALSEYVKSSASDKVVQVAGGAAMGAAWGPLGLLAGAFVGIGTNLLSNCIQKRQEAQEALTQFLTNEHIARLQALTLRQELVRLSAACALDGNWVHWSKRIKALAERSENWWLTEVNNPARPDLEVFRETSVVNALTAQLTSKEEPRYDPTLWLPALERANLQFDRRDALPGDALLVMANHLSDHYAEAWKNALKYDFGHDGKAYAAVSLHFYAQILSAVDRQGSDVAELRGLMEQLPALLAQLTQVANVLRDLNGMSVSSAAHLDAGIAQLQRLLPDMETRMKDHSADVARSEADRVIATMADPKHAREVLRRAAEERYEAQLKEIDKIPDWRERQRQRSAQVELVATRMAHVDILIADILQDEELGSASPIGQEMHRILSEEGPVAALTFLEQREPDLMQEVRLIKRTREIADALFIQAVRRALLPKLNRARLLEIQGRLVEAQAQYLKVIQEEPTWVMARRALFGALVSQADELSIVGTLDDRRKVLDVAHTLVKDLVEAYPEDLEVRHALAVSSSRQGVLFQHEGKLREAGKAFEEVRSICQALSKAEPDNASVMRSLSTSHLHLGVIAVREGDELLAKQEFKEGINVLKSLIKAYPRDVVLQRLLSIGYERLGDCWCSGGHLDKARVAFEEVLDIRTRLLSVNPMDLQAQQDLSLAHSKLGDLFFAMGDLPRAHRSTKLAFDLREQFLKAHPLHLEGMRDLSTSHERLGNILGREGKFAEAQGETTDALELRQKLVELDPNNKQDQHDLAILHNKLGDVLVTKKELGNASEAFDTARRMLLALRDTDPNNFHVQRDLSISYSKLGDLHMSAGNLVEARSALEEALRIRQVSYGPYIVQARDQVDLCISYERLVRLDLAEGKRQEAIDKLCYVHQLSSRYISLNPGFPPFVGVLVYATTMLLDMGATIHDENVKHQLRTWGQEARAAMLHLQSIGSALPHHDKRLADLDLVIAELD